MPLRQRLRVPEDRRHPGAALPPPAQTADPPSGSRPSRHEIEPAAQDLVRRRGEESLATARAYAATPEDADDAYQRGLEILLTKAPSTDEE